MQLELGQHRRGSNYLLADLLPRVRVKFGDETTREARSQKRLAVALWSLL